MTRDPMPAVPAARDGVRLGVVRGLVREVIRQPIPGDGSDVRRQDDQGVLTVDHSILIVEIVPEEIAVLVRHQPSGARLGVKCCSLGGTRDDRTDCARRARARGMILGHGGLGSENRTAGVRRR